MYPPRLCPRRIIFSSPIALLHSSMYWTNLFSASLQSLENTGRELRPKPGKSNAKTLLSSLRSVKFCAHQQTPLMNPWTRTSGGSFDGVRFTWMVHISTSSLTRIKLPIHGRFIRFRILDSASWSFSFDVGNHKLDTQSQMVFKISLIACRTEISMTSIAKTKIKFEAQSRYKVCLHRINIEITWPQMAPRAAKCGHMNSWPPSHANMLQCLFDPIQVQPALMRDIYIYIFFCEKPTELYLFWVWPYLLKYSPIMRVRRGDLDCGIWKLTVNKTEKHTETKKGTICYKYLLNQECT